MQSAGRKPAHCQTWAYESWCHLGQIRAISSGFNSSCTIYRSRQAQFPALPQREGIYPQSRSKKHHVFLNLCCVPCSWCWTLYWMQESCGFNCCLEYRQGSSWRSTYCSISDMLVLSLIACWAQYCVIAEVCDVGAEAQAVSCTAVVGHLTWVQLTAEAESVLQQNLCFGSDFAISLWLTQGCRYIPGLSCSITCHWRGNTQMGVALQHLCLLALLLFV